MTLRFRRNTMSEIVDGLFISSLKSAADPTILNENSITTVLSLLECYQPSFFQVDHIDYRFIQMGDFCKQELLMFLDQTYEIISNALENNRKILIHCEYGVSPSAAVVIGYLMKKQDLSFIAAREFVKTKRGCARPNLGFQRQLALYELVRHSLNMTSLFLKQYVIIRLVTAYLKNYSPRFDTNFQYYLQFFKNFPETENEFFLYKCKACKFMLFNQTSVLYNKPEHQVIYIILTEWIAEQEYYLKFWGKIYCPQCGFELGLFNWLRNEKVTYSYSVREDKSCFTTKITVPLVFAVTYSRISRVQGADYYQ